MLVRIAIVMPSAKNKQFAEKDNSDFGAGARFWRRLSAIHGRAKVEMNLKLAH
jgi:hypothetical protein